MNFKKKKLIVLLSMAVATIAMADDATTNKLTTTKLDKVVVTANKMEEDVKDIPASISVISDIDIEDKGIKNIEDVVKQVPNLSLSKSVHGRAINFRGINQSVFTSANPVVIYSDGVPQNSIFDYDVMLENVERVEVLRGPQSTLYGKNTIGGVINVIGKEPENEWTGSLGLEYGSNNYLLGSVNARGALIDDKLFLNLGMVGNQDDGWITNDYDGSHADDEKEFKFNATLTAKPTERLTAKLTLGAKKVNTHFLKGGNNPKFNAKRSDFEHANYDMPFFNINKSFSQALNFDYDFDNIKFSSLSTHKKMKTNGLFDADHSYDPTNASNMNGLYMYHDIETDELSQEFKLSNNNENNRLKWVAGIYFSKEIAKNNRMGMQFPVKKMKLDLDIPSKSTAKTMAIFGQASYDVTEALALTLGGRYQKIKKDISLTSYMFPMGAGHAGAINSFSRNETASWSSFLPKFALSYAINDKFNTYFSYSKGYLPGGFNYFPTSPNDVIKFNAQESDNYEIGVRGSLLNNKLNLGAALFYINIDDIHLYKAGADGKGNPFYITSNGGKAKSKGVELDATYHINKNWTVNGAFGFTDAKYTQHTNKAFNGNYIQTTPKYTANLGLAYFSPQGFYGRLDVNSQGSVYFDEANKLRQKAWVTSDLKLGYMKNNFNIYAYVKNISNAAYIENYMTHGVGATSFNKPRFFGVGMKYNF